MICEAVTVISLSVQVNAKGIPVSLRARVLPCRVVRRNWDGWVKRGLVVRLGSYRFVHAGKSGVGWTYARGNASVDGTEGAAV